MDFEEAVWVYAEWLLSWCVQEPPRHPSDRMFDPFSERLRAVIWGKDARLPPQVNGTIVVALRIIQRHLPVVIR